MLVESFVVLILILVISYFCVRSGNRGTGLSILPLLILPSFYLSGFWLAPRLARWGLSPIKWTLLFVMLGLLLQGLIIGAIAHGIEQKRVRHTYLGLCCGFMLVFLVMIIQSILPT